MTTAVMLMGITLNVVAADVRTVNDVVSDSEMIDVEGDGVADCYISCNYGSGYATAITMVYANDEVSYIYAYASVDVEIMDASGTVEYHGSDDDDDEKFNTDTARATAEFSENVSYNVAIFAESSHEAIIDFSEASNSLYVESY